MGGVNILLINPPWIKKEGNVWKNVSSCMPSHGIAYIAAFLEARGVNVRILDCNAERVPLDRLAEKLKTYDQPSYIGITATTSLITNALEAARICKDTFTDSKVVIGGVHPTILPAEVLGNDSVDFVVRGEGEVTTAELVEGKAPKDIPGLSYKEDGKIVHNGERGLIDDLDGLHMPAYHLLPMERYFPALGTYKRLPAMSVFATRGCPGRCTFCYCTFGGKLRKRSARNIAEEIKYLVKNHGVKEILFYDDTFTVFKENVKELCSILISEKVDISWVCYARVDYIGEELLRLMKEAGCHQICYGIESASEEILKNINKRISLEEVRKAVRLTKEAGIEARGTFMFGNPGETEETMKKTIDFAIELGLDLAIFNITTPYPGTAMYKWAKESGCLVTEDWTKYDLSTVVMHLPTVTPEKIEEFYKIAYRRFYLRPSYIIRKILSIRSFAELRENLRAFHAFISFNL